MDDLFEKLKAEPPVNMDSVSKSQKRLCSEDFRSKGNSSPRRESLPALNSTIVTKPKSKCRSMSPVAENLVKSCKTLLDRKKLKELVTKEFGTQNGTKIEKASKPTLKSVSTNECMGREGSAKKVMPTKAQQKLFEPIELPTSPPKIKTSTKSCKVRIKRQNLEKLREEFAELKKIENSKKKKEPSPKKEKRLEKAGNKRKAEEMNESVPRKKVRTSKTPQKESPTAGSKKSKPSTGFFIKISSSPPSSKKLATTKRHLKPQSPVTIRDKSPRKINSRLIASSPVWTTKATKFTRTQLINSFGKRYFNSFVKIERCIHPMMVTYEFDARDRKQQARNKSKNLSVSFKEQVEIIGCSDTESNDSEETTKDRKNQASPIVTPARLEKVSNGKVIDDIIFDPKLFCNDSMGSNSSTPLRKKPEKKSYSPLKDDSASSSARSKQLKLANEKLPPCGLRQLVAESDNDDEDEDAEYIVPIDLPFQKKRNSYTTPIKKNDEDLVVNKTNTKISKNEPDNIKTSGNVQIEVYNEKTSNEDANKTQDIAAENVKITKNNSNENKKTTNETQNCKEVEHVNDNDNGCQTKKQEKGEEHSNGNEPKVSEACKRLKTVTENDSCTSNPPFASNTHENINLMKTVIKELSKGMEISELNTKDSERSPSVNVITTESAPIST